MPLPQQQQGQQQGQQQQQQQQQGLPPQSQAPSGGGGGGGGGAPPASADRYGLLGLLSVIRMTDADLTTLALGTDLTSLGLALNSPEPVHRTFASPWADAPGRPDPDWSPPPCYLHTPPPLAPGEGAAAADEAPPLLTPPGILSATTAFTPASSPGASGAPKHRT